MIANVSKSLVRATQSFKADERGNVAMIFGLMVVTLMALVGGAVDFASYSRTKSAYRDAVDGAVLAAARIKQTGGSDAEAIATANAFVEAVKAKHPLSGSVTFAIVDSGVAVQGTADLAMPTSFLNVVAMNSLQVKTTSTARFAQPSDLEISLMLDVTGSMNGQKLQDLKDAVVDLTNIVISDNPSTNKARIALAPFANAVKLNSNQFRGRDRDRRRRLRRRTARRRNLHGRGADHRQLCDAVGGRCAQRQLRGPRDLSVVGQQGRHHAEGARPDGRRFDSWAHRHGLGLVHAVAELGVVVRQRSAAGFVCELKQKNPSGAPKLRKILVLMTDGEYNTQYIGDDSTTQARALCAEIKKTGIEVFSIGFDVSGNQTVIDTLRGCANTSAHFYEATSGDGLKTAFRDIALKASTIRLTQ